MMKLRHYLDPGTAASVVIHAVLLASVLVFSGIRPFDSKTAQAITVDLVTPEEIKPPAEKEPPPPETKQPEFKLPDLKLRESLDKPSEPEQQSAPAAPQTEAPTPPPAAQPSPVEKQPAPTQQAATPAQQQPPPTQQPLPQQPATPPAVAPAFQPPEPDLTVKYGVMLGLPDASGKSDFDNAAFAAAKVSSQEIQEFRRHLKACSPMPENVSTADDVWIKLRAAFTPDGRLATTPILIEGKASPKALALANGAIAAMQACQPYAMLPADKYNEWKILDLEFSPRDFHSG